MDGITRAANGRSSRGDHHQGSRYLHRPVAEIAAELIGATQRFTEEWRQRVADSRDEARVIRFYNESETELFDLAKWHAEDQIHYRTLMCCDLARQRPGRMHLDYGSGIGSDALVFASAGFNVTLADVSEPLLRFARWRCASRGFEVGTIDLKTEALHKARYDSVVCLNVLEHIHRPLRTLRSIHAAMTRSGLLFVHAPFGHDADRPCTWSTRTWSRLECGALAFSGVKISSRISRPGSGRRASTRRCRCRSSTDGYQIYDGWLNGPVGDRIARVYRQLLPRNS